MPFLRLQGRWLDEAGFAIGANVRVEVSAGRLVVELAEPAHTEPRRQARFTPMPSIAESALERLKQTISLQRLTEARGVELKHHCANLIGR